MYLTIQNNQLKVIQFIINDNNINTYSLIILFEKSFLNSEMNK